MKASLYGNHSLIVCVPRSVSEPKNRIAIDVDVAIESTNILSLNVPSIEATLVRG